MKFALFIAFLAILLASCDMRDAKTQSNQNKDSRPKSQLLFNSKVDSLKNDYSSINNSAKTDVKSDEFNKYALDSLKDVKNWEVIVNDISDNTYDASSFARQILDLKQPIYNLKMYSVIRMYDSHDSRLDSLNIPQGEVIYLTYTTYKQPKKLMNIVDLIKTLNRGDTLLISGAITHIDNRLKPNFKDLIIKGSDWNVDLLPTRITKK